MLKEEGDDMKQANGEYRVYDSLWNSKHESGAFRLVRCLKCKHTNAVRAFGDE
jgi:hypothetical protein